MLIIRTGWAGLLLICLCAVGCSGPTLVPTPNLYTNGNDHPFDEVPERFQSNRVELIYATDREPIDTDDDELVYGHGRSQSSAIGTCTVTIGDDLTWEELVEASTTRHRMQELPLAVEDIDELIRFPSSSTSSVRTPKGLATDPEVLAERDRSIEKAIELFERRLESCDKKEVFIFIHGYNNTFDDAAFRMAQLWHFMGREGVPVIYTWPAGHGGMLRGYNYDRESGEFTIYHLRQFLKTIALIPSLEKVHIVAHSRGTDVALTALRELHLEISGTGADTNTRLKFGTLVLAAPDLDWEVAQQRITAERFLHIADHVTIYLSKEDKAIGIAGWLFASVQRIGRLRVEDLTPEQQEAIAEAESGEIIDVRVRTGFIGHGYFINNPAVLSDLILLLRDKRHVGEEHGRPLESKDRVFWLLRDGYPNRKPRKPKKS